ncbi:MAG: hypothetical protein V1847_01070 [Candidatus Diapherotrites archaeon]
MANVKSQVDKWKRKRWFTILAPKVFDEKPLTETPAEKPEMVIGRTIRVFGREVSPHAKRSPTQLIFQVEDVQGSNAHTSLAGIEMNSGEIKRALRRRNSKVDVVQTITSKDGVTARLHTVVVSGTKLSQPQGRILYHQVREEVDKAAKEMNFDKMVYEIVCGNLLGDIHNKVKKIAPIKRIEVLSARRQKGKA